MSTDTSERKRGGGKKKPLKLYGNSKRDVYDSRPAEGWGGKAGSAIPAYFTFSGGFLIINNSCSGKKCQIAVIFTVELYIIFSKRSRWAWKWRDPIDPRFHWFPLFFFPFFFKSVPKQRDGRSSSCEKVSLWMRMVKHWAPGRGAAWETTAADRAAFQTRGGCGGGCRGVPDTLQRVICQHLMRPPWLSNRRRLSVGDMSAVWKLPRTPTSQQMCMCDRAASVFTQRPIKNPITGSNRTSQIPHLYMRFRNTIKGKGW